VIRDGHLFLSLMADGGTYEYAPLVVEPTSPVASRGPSTFDCTPKAGGASITLTATFFDTKPSLVLLESGGDTRPAFQVRAASGARFEGTGVSFWEARGEATVRWKGADLTCRRR
jgi:membrane-bound inhibitor of C-type lysozyme